MYMISNVRLVINLQIGSGCNRREFTEIIKAAGKDSVPVALVVVDYFIIILYPSTGGRAAGRAFFISFCTLNSHLSVQSL